MSNKNIRNIELLAPAKDKNVAITAINCGADAIYIGASKFGARAAAGNDIDDIKEIVDYAHKFNVKVYVTINTIIYNDELDAVKDVIDKLYKIGVDALIVQDMGILRLDISPIQLHASTQCDIRNVEKAKLLSEVGFSQLVLARELSLNEIKDIHNNVSAPLEVFVHGALCVSYSGRCELSQVCKNRSANRGECAQMCRLPYDLVDSKGHIYLKGKHLLSLKDLNQSDNLEDLIEAGGSSFKIEGRLKDVDYVANVVSYYRKKIDAIITKYPTKYKRSSFGESFTSFNPQLDKSFNRSFTNYYLLNRALPNKFSIASINSPKSQGEYIGKVVSCKGKSIIIETNKELANGDGFSYYDKFGNYNGFRINKVEGKNRVLVSTIVNIPKGTILYRTYDKEFNDTLTKSIKERRLNVNMTLRKVANGIALDVSDEIGNNVSVYQEIEDDIQAAKTSQEQKQISCLGKLGDTIYKLNECSVLGELFIPMSILTDLRRKGIDSLSRAQKITYKHSYRKEENKGVKYFTDSIDFTANVSNRLSEEFYRSHGVTNVERAIEVDVNSDTRNKALMNTRYCIRRELGCCNKTSKSKDLPQDLFLNYGNIKLKLEFDCKKCEMLVYNI